MVFITKIVSAQTIADFENLLQKKAFETAGYGMYNGAQIGSGDPHDYYTPSMWNKSMATESGDTTKTDLFYGVCTDYAYWMYKSIQKNKELFERYGMMPNQFYIASSGKNQSTGITLYDPVSSITNSDIVLNGIYMKKFKYFPVATHDNVTNHAWVWIQHKNGTWYWVDPTWTDNTGRIVFGTVSNTREIQKVPDERLCVVKNTITPPSDNSTYYVKNTFWPTLYYGVLVYSEMMNGFNMLDFGFDIFNEKNTFGLSVEIMYYNNDTTDTYKRIDGWNYEYSNYNEYAFYLSIHYSFLKLWNNTIFVGGTLGLGYHGAHQSGSGFSSGYPPDLSGMKEGDIKKGITFKAGGYVMYCLNNISFKALIEYKTFGEFSFGLGIGMMF
jgi:hypothetical protein